MVAAYLFEGSGERVQKVLLALRMATHPEITFTLRGRIQDLD